MTVVSLLSVTLGCVSTATPRNANDICQMFDEKRSWYRSAALSEERWGISIPILMAVIYRESTFQATVRPPRTKILGIFPGPRPSTSIGYAQAKDETWNDYMRATKKLNASRTNFADSIDFVGWYLARGVKHAGISPTDARKLYFTYHLGLNGYKSGAWQKSTKVQSAGATVQSQANHYATQLKSCKVRRGLFR